MPKNKKTRSLEWLVKHLDVKATQEEAGMILGISQQRVSVLLRNKILTEGADVRTWIREYTENMQQIIGGYPCALCGKRK